MIFLIDHNIEGQALILLGLITKKGWLDLLPISFLTFDDVSLPIDSNDRIVWRFAQANQMILLTGNRSIKGEDSLEQVMREENNLTSLPVITIGNIDRIEEPIYREYCVNRLVEIVLYLDDYKGSMRLFIP
ncbi:MAG: ACP S-malonyltransferase [Crocosphaera sp.]